MRCLAALLFVFLTAILAAAPPQLSLPDLDGKRVTLAEYRDKRPVLLVFYRGWW